MKPKNSSRSGLASQTTWINVSWLAESSLAARITREDGASARFTPLLRSNGDRLAAERLYDSEAGALPGDAPIRAEAQQVAAAVRGADPARPIDEQANGRRVDEREPTH